MVVKPLKFEDGLRRVVASQRASSSWLFRHHATAASIHEGMERYVRTVHFSQRRCNQSPLDVVIIIKSTSIDDLLLEEVIS